MFAERDLVSPDTTPATLSEGQQRILDQTIRRLRQARQAGASRMLAFGAHTIKNGLAPVLIRLIEQGWLTHLATNGAGIIHDWEFAWQGHSSEHVAENVRDGVFGLWEETGYYLNLALLVGAFEGLGYGEAVGKMVEREGLDIPSEEALRAAVTGHLDSAPEQAAAAADLLAAIQRHGLLTGWMDAPHRHKALGLQAAAYRFGTPFTGHPMIGHDIIYEHPLNACAAIGRTAQRDFLTFADGVSRLEGGVYMSIGSAVMSPMIFEKSMAMGQNLALLEGRRIEHHWIVVADLAEAGWDWSQGEPPEEHPDYYLRYNKSFSRMGGEMRYLQIDNRDFLLALYQGLTTSGPSPQGA